MDVNKNKQLNNLLEDSISTLTKTTGTPNNCALLTHSKALVNQSTSNTAVHGIYAKRVVIIANIPTIIKGIIFDLLLSFIFSSNKSSLKTTFTSLTFFLESFFLVSFLLVFFLNNLSVFFNPLQ